jgi:rhodanese-related sulfurtransferase
MSLPALLAASDARPGGYRDLPPLEAAAHLAALHLVDVREPDEFTGPLGHVPGAELIPLSTVRTSVGQLDPAAPTLVICRSGGRSARAASELVALGFTEVYNLAGGMLAWDAHELPREGGVVR